MKRIVFALLALTVLLAPALFGRADDAGAQAARGPSFPDAAFTFTLDEDADGSTTPVAIGTPILTAGTIGGGTDACAISATNGQYENASDAPADFIQPDTAGATAVNVFAVDPASCAITYTGSGATRTDGTLEAYSLTVTVSDGVDAAGSTDASVDDTIAITVKIVNVATDREALIALHTAAGGSGWTDDANWSPPAVAARFSHTFELTAAVTAGVVGYYGITSPAVGAIRESSGNVTPDGTTYEISALTLTGTLLDLALTPTTAGAPAANAAADFRCFNLRVVGASVSVSLNLDSPSTAGEQSGRYHWQWTAPANLLATGDFRAVLEGRENSLPGWHGVSSPGCGRVAGLDLGGNGLTGSIPAALADLSALASLDLSGNAGLTGSIPVALTALTGLTTLDLSGTGVCVDPDDAILNGWLGSIRAKSGGSALVPVCGAGGPSFARTARTFTLDDGADGSTTAIAIGAPVLTAGTSGGTDACALSATNGQYPNPSDDPRDFIEPDTAGATAVNDFAVAPATCAITYTGTGATRSPTLEAYSLTVTVSDGVDAAGAADARVDDTIRVTVRILSAATDRAALDKFYTATGGSGWGNSANWNEGPVRETVTLHTFELTGATGGGSIGYNNSKGAVRNASDRYTLSGTEYRVTTLIHFGNNLIIRLNPQAAQTAFRCLSLRIDTTTVDFASPTASSASQSDWQFRWTGASLVPTGLIAVGDFDAELRGPRTFDDWHGVGVATCEGGRATSIDLRDNGLTGSIPGDLAELSALTSLDLSGNTGLTGGIPAALTAHTGLTALNLRGTGVCVEPDDAAVNGWLASIRAKPGGSALVPVCGVVGPSFAHESFILTLDEGVAGSPTPLAIGAPVLMAGTSGGTDACALSETNGQYANPSADPAAFIEPDTAGATAVNVFAVDAASCAITYTGMGAERTANTLEAYSLTVTVSDGVDTAGAADARVDDAIRVTVTILNVDTDRAALEAFYDAAGGARWANRANWKEADFRDYPLVHTFKLTAAVGPGVPGYTGYDGGSNIGAVRESSNRVDLDGAQHEVIHLSLGGSGGDTVTLLAQPAATARQAFRCYHLQIGPARLSFADAVVTPGFSAITFRWGGQATDLIAVGDFEAQLHSTGTFGDWAGVSTDSCGRVTQLCPAGCSSDVANVLSGSLPPELGQLSRLTLLRINGLPDGPPLALSGGIPPELGNLRSLRQLWITRTTLSGAIPRELEGLRNLDRLYLHDNAFSGALPDLRGMSRLRTLHAWNNRLSAFPPDGGTFEATSATTYGWTARCNSRFGRGLGQFLATQEQAADAASAWIAAQCGSGGGTSTMTSATTYGWTARCDFSAERDSGSGIASPGEAAADARVWLAHCPAHWPPNLQDLRLSNNAFVGEAPELQSLSALRFLHLDGNRLSVFPALWPENLWDLHLNGNAFTGPVPNLSRLSDLQNLYLQNNQLSGPIPRHVNLLSNIQRLRLDGNRLTGPIQNYGTLQRLRELRLNDNQLDGGIPANLSLLRLLQRLHLQNNRLTGTIPATLNGLRNLFELDLSGNDLEGVIPDLRDTRMAFLSLAGNRLTLLPASLGQLDRMVALHLHGNRFAEAIPDLSAATRLERLTLNGNQFSGEIPDWLPTLTSLTQLDLSDNKLTGRVTTLLASLTAMRRLDLSENRLTCVSSSVIRGWINGIRRAGGTASVDICGTTPGVPGGGGGGGGAVIGGGGGPPVAYLVITVRTEGDAPRGSVYALSIGCDSGSYSVSLIADQSHTAGVTPGGTCTLAVTNRQGASEVRGEFADRLFGAGVTPVTLTMTYPAAAEEEEEEMEEEEEEEMEETPAPVRELDAELVVGRTLVSWTGREMPVAGVVEALTLRVTAIHRWDGTTQTWRSWFPGGDALGVNSFFAFEPRGIYFVYAGERPAAAGQRARQR